MSNIYADIKFTFYFCSCCMSSGRYNIKTETTFFKTAVFSPQMLNAMRTVSVLILQDFQDLDLD